MRAYVRRLLGDRFDVAAVPDGKAALDAARARKPDLVLSDVMMPRLDGFGLLRELRADPQLCEIPVILLSARAGEEARIEGMEARADDYLIKPFSARELLALVESHLKMSRFRHEATEAVRQAERNASLLASIVESSDDAIVSKNLEGIIMSWNQGAERLFGYTAAEVIGKSINILIPPDRLEEEPRILARLRRGERVDHFETIRVRKDGSRLNISLTISPVKDAQGRVVGASKIARDITERVRQEQALQIANAALHQANADLQLFAYSASHDLQEPLRMLRVYSELLQETFGGQLGRGRRRVYSSHSRGRNPDGQFVAGLEDLYASIRSLSSAARRNRCWRSPEQDSPKPSGCHRGEWRLNHRRRPAACPHAPNFRWNSSFKI